MTMSYSSFGDKQGAESTLRDKMRSLSSSVLAGRRESPRNIGSLFLSRDSHCHILSH